ncbi:MAG: saccharopine dehydrogenase [bacterium (Candidatus Stahlbacteria) CG08_land_8_20_14_0_20_40_26]|nr:MAG: saccharopine dehydrogenase [bacterium (Candidatus Stahlbacteria) CG23_combo_of_CG06-09_8_20_14_all_40_9]PIS25571.1 MAG: saccharopine dehydrogenase [bacterium (Candidatus Stahlbacteria) CG08_land_8_20_14_0_20_40_26]
MKNALVFGAGLVAGPLVKYLLDNGIRVTIASRTLRKAEKLVGEHQNGIAREFNIENDDPVPLINDADLVISLLPYVYHTKIAEICINLKKNMVTTSYVSEKMGMLDEEAKKTGIIILNEVGLDPGIDHMSAMEIINGVKAKGGRVKGFHSYCGGLPAPEANTNPWGYKFSWSPRGVVLAAKNNARYLKSGEEIKVPNTELFKHYWTIDIENLGKFEAYPNRDSIPYIEKYSITGIEDMYRGTLRNIGWCDTWYCIRKLGLLSEEKKDFHQMTYKEFMASLIGHKNISSIKGALARFLDINENSDIIKRFEWLGLLSDEKIPEDEMSPQDILANKLNEKLQYEEGERDMIILRHEFDIEYRSQGEKIISTLVDYGIPYGFSSMSRTVGLPAAISSKLILDGSIDIKGVHIPIIEEIYKPVLKELKKEGIKFEEKYFEPQSSQR